MQVRVRSSYPGRFNPKFPDPWYSIGVGQTQLHARCGVPQRLMGVHDQCAAPPRETFHRVFPSEPRSAPRFAPGSRRLIVFPSHPSALTGGPPLTGGPSAFMRCPTRGFNMHLGRYGGLMLGEQARPRRWPWQQARPPCGPSTYGRRRAGMDWMIEESRSPLQITGNRHRWARSGSLPRAK